MEIMRLSNGSAGRILTLGIILYLAILFIFILPEHDHSDHFEHHDCALCIFILEQSTTVLLFVLPAIQIICCSAVIIFRSIVILPVLSSVQSRAPPLQ